MKVRATLTDLWRDDWGWSENASWCRVIEFEMPDWSSDLQIARQVKRRLGIQGMRRDGWAGELSWRDGAVGAYASTEHET